LYHLHFFVRWSFDWRRHLCFRDRLFASPELAARYSQVKLAAAREAGGDRERYQELKGPFIEEVQNQ
jgi:GrpB-like predicted nucleotidyltransferase (UPF0157 family)